MRKLFFIIVLFLSTNLLAEVFNCEMNIKSSTFGDQKYSLLVDIGKETELALTTADIETGKFAGNIGKSWKAGGDRSNIHRYVIVYAVTILESLF